MPCTVLGRLGISSFVRTFCVGPRGDSGVGSLLLAICQREYNIVKKLALLHSRDICEALELVYQGVKSVDP
jgi:hypothetical protein